MRLVIQRVSEASVEVGEKRVAAIGPGLLVLVGVASGDAEADAGRAAEKIASLRVFADSAGKMNLDLAAVGGEVLAVSQFTLLGSLDKGRRPSFDAAMEPKRARELFEAFVAELRRRGPRVETGVFREDMRVALVNDGPVTFVFDTRQP